jgi:hypothetical protein
MFSAGCSRFALHRDRARTAPIQLVQDLLQRTELVGPAHEMPGQQPHALLSRTRRRHRSFETTRSRRIPLTSFTETRPADRAVRAGWPRNAGPKVPAAGLAEVRAGWRGKLRVRLRVILRHLGEHPVLQPPEQVRAAAGDLSTASAARMHATGAGRSLSEETQREVKVG